MSGWGNIRATVSIHRWRILTILFLTAMIFLIGQTILGAKNVNDTWILEGLLPSFAAFTILYFIIVSFSPNLGVVTGATSIYMLVLNSIPLLKYAFVYGFFDPLPHYEFVEGITMTGYVPTNASYSVQYGHAPGSHVLAASLSTITGMNPALGYKLYLAICPLVLPLTVYLVIKKLKPPLELSRAVIVATAIVSPILYRFTGTMAAFSVFFLLIYLALIMATSKDSSPAVFVAAILVGVRLIASHDVTSFFVMICLSSIVLTHFVTTRRSPSRLFTSFSLVFIILSLSYSITVSSVNFATIWQLIRNSFESLFLGRAPEAPTYYTGFYTLNLSGKIFVTLVRYGKEIASMSLSILAPLALIRLSFESDRLKPFYRALVPPSLFAALTFIMTLFIRERVITRGLVYFAAFSPFLVGITLFWAFGSRKHRLKGLVLTLVFLALFSVSLVQHYPCQPLIPKISEGNERYYVMDLRAVNSIYKRSLISYVSLHDSELDIATDSVTWSQILALGSQTIKSMKYDSSSQVSSEPILILVSNNGLAHVVASGRQAIENYNMVLNLTRTTSVIYSNGRSFALFEAAP